VAADAAPAKRLLLDHDGHSTFSTLSPDFRRDIDEVVAACPPNVTTYLLCPGAGRYYYPTKVGETDPRCTQLAAEHAVGRDPFGYFLGKLKAAGKETFVTVRMNDVHEPTAADEWNLPKVRRAHPDAIVDAAAVARGYRLAQLGHRLQPARGAGVHVGDHRRVAGALRIRRHATRLDAFPSAPLGHA